MKLKFTCCECGKILGYYKGEPFILENANVDIKVLCSDCYVKRQKLKT